MDEAAVCVPIPVKPDGFNKSAKIPYGLKTAHILRAMESFVSFLQLVNQALHGQKMDRLESILMPANFSSIVSEFVGAAIPKFHPKLVRNRYPNGHPDLIPAGIYPDDRIKIATEGIEVKGSQRPSGWQGHNPEDTWIMVFIFESNKPADKLKGAEPKPFRFRLVVGAKLVKDDWRFSGRSETSRRTVTASIKRSGYDKMFGNWIYKDQPSGRSR
jgi:hypothetical protein